MKLKNVLTGLSFYFLAIFTASADCEYGLNIPALNYTWSGSNSPTAYNLTISSSESDSLTCLNYLIGFSKGGSNSYSRVATNSSTGATLSYNLFKSSNGGAFLKSLSDATSLSEVIAGTLTKNSSETLSYFFTLGALSTSALVRGGVYRDSITVTAATGLLPPILGSNKTTNLPVIITIPKSASLSLVDTGGAYNPSSTNKILDFGELSANEEMSLDVIVVSNAGYKLSVSSANNEYLKISGVPSTSSNQINYDFYANGIQKDLSSSASSAVTLSTGAGVTPIEGNRIPLKVVIQSVTNKDSGTYQDYLTFTIATTE